MYGAYHMIEMDSTCVLKLIPATTDVHHSSHSLIRVIKDLMAKEWEVVALHTYHEANQCADGMAKQSHDTTHGVAFVFDYLGSFIFVPFHADLAGVSFPRVSFSV